jgi:hypothetical protein
MQAKRLMNGFEVIYRYFGLRNKQLQAEMNAGKPNLIGARPSFESLSEIECCEFD